MKRTAGERARERLVTHFAMRLGQENPGWTWQRVCREARRAAHRATHRQPEPTP